MTRYWPIIAWVGVAGCSLNTAAASVVLWRADPLMCICVISAAVVGIVAIADKIAAETA